VEEQKGNDVNLVAAVTDACQDFVADQKVYEAQFDEEIIDLAEERAEMEAIKNKPSRSKMTSGNNY
jgi:hypothetical protein